MRRCLTLADRQVIESMIGQKQGVIATAIGFGTDAIGRELRRNETPYSAEAAQVRAIETRAHYSRARRDGKPRKRPCIEPLPPKKCACRGTGERVFHRSFMEPLVLGCRECG